jgi:hypothetical protein
MPTTPTNVQQLRNAGIIPPDAILPLDQENAIEALSQKEVDTVIEVFQKVGPIEVSAPTWLIKIF